MSKRDIQIKTADGTAKASLFATPGAKAGVIVYIDAFGVRPAMDAIAERIGSWGFAVLVPDTLYRFQPYGPFVAKTAFSDEQNATKIRSMISGTTQAMSRSDSGFFIEALDAAGVSGPIGTVGYCMGGARALNAAAGYPDRVRAAASFHGGNLAADAPDSPHNHAAEIKARVYVGSAGVDKSFPPEQSARLAEALRTAEVDHLIENYVGMAHGWCVSDHGVYDERGAERHFARLETLFAETLNG